MAALLAPLDSEIAAAARAADPAAALLDLLTDALGPGAAIDLVDRVGRRTFARQAAEWARVTQRMPARVDAGERVARLVLGEWVGENVDLIASLPDALDGDIRAAVAEAFEAGSSPSQLEAILVERLGIAESRARLIARDQVQKLHGRLDEQRNRAAGFERYVWRTARDERVRSSHAAREGQVFRWDAPPQGGAPGFAINCRCVAEPLDEDD